MTAKEQPQRSLLTTLLEIVGGLLLAISLLASGFFVDTLPATTRLLSENFSNTTLAKYPAENLTELAVACRDYTVDPRPEGLDGARNELADCVLSSAIEASSPQSSVFDRWNKQACFVVDTLSDDSSPAQAMNRLAQCGEGYSFDSLSLSHLDDCNNLIQRALPILGICILGALAILGYFAGTRQRKKLGRVLMAAPCVLIACLVCLGLWAALDFQGFFSAFHGLFFPQGNWTFALDSLLITMYPTPFWMGMGVLWLSCTTLLSILSFVLGLFIFKRSA